MAELQRGSPEWWLGKLLNLQNKRLDTFERYEDYYEGRHDLKFATEKFHRAFGSLFRRFSDNWTALPVDVVEERLDIEGFRFGGEEGDRDAWEIWQRNLLDKDSQMLHQEALLHGGAYVLVWPDSEGEPEILVESPLQMVAVNVDGSTRKRAAALKRWVEDDGHEMATLYLPDGIYKFRSKQGLGKDDLLRTRDFNPLHWDRREVPDEAWPLPNRLNEVPVVPLVNRPRILKPGRSEIADVIPIQNAVNKIIADMLVASEVGAFRQRWVTGLDIPVDPETNQPIEPFKSAVERLFVAEHPDTKFGEFEATDLRNFVQVIEMFVQHIASQTRTPPHYFFLRGEFPSGESLRAAEASLVAKARRKMRFFGESWEEVMRLAFAVKGDPRRDEFRAETIWADPEFRTESQHMDAVSKKQAMGVPLRQLWEDMGYTQTQIERFKEWRAEEALEVATFDPFSLNGKRVREEV